MIIPDIHTTSDAYDWGLRVQLNGLGFMVIDAAVIVPKLLSVAHTDVAGIDSFQSLWLESCKIVGDGQVRNIFGSYDEYARSGLQIDWYTLSQ